MEGGGFPEEVVVLCEFGLEVVVVLGADEALVLRVDLLHVGRAALLLQPLRRAGRPLLH